MFSNKRNFVFSVSPGIHTELLQKPSESGVFVNQAGTDISKLFKLIQSTVFLSGGIPSKSIL